MSLQFCHIAPTPHLEHFAAGRSAHLLLAHLVEKDNTYADFYKKRKLHSQFYILDNSAFEMYKAGREMYAPEKLIEMGKRVHADYIVMSDYPNEPGSKTIQAAEQLAPQFKQAGFGTFFVPQSRIGDIEDYIACFAWAASSPLVDYIGVSILGVPNAYGVEKDNKLQRFFSRWKMMKTLEERGILALAAANGKLIHFLGMVDGPNEIELCKEFTIHTWDSSAAVWAGLNGIAFDSSPTGLVDGKFEKEVDFGLEIRDNTKVQLAHDNIKYIDRLCRERS
jgi:hypothetical protein